MNLSRLFLLLAMALVVAVAIGAGLFFAFGGTTYFSLIFNSGNVSERARAASDLLAQGDFSGAARAAGGIDTSTSDSRTAARVASIEGFANIMGGTTEGRRTALDLMKAAYMDPASTPAQKAVAANNVLEYLMTTRSASLAIEAFTGEPFAQFGVPGDALASTKKLAEHSLSLYPSTVAVWYIALWDAARINNFDKNYHATEAEKEVHAGEVVKYVHQAEEMWENREQYAPHDSGTSYLSPVRYYYWRGYLYSIASAVEPRYATNAEASFRQAIQYYKETKGPDGKSVPVVENRIPTTYMAYAALIYKTDDVSRHEEIRSLLREVMTMIQNDPGLHETGYVAVLRRVAKSPKTNPREYANYKNLVSIDTDFKAFLEGYGVKF